MLVLTKKNEEIDLVWIIKRKRNVNESCVFVVSTRTQEGLNLLRLLQVHHPTCFHQLCDDQQGREEDLKRP